VERFTHRIKGWENGGGVRTNSKFEKPNVRTQGARRLDRKHGWVPCRGNLANLATSPLPRRRGTERKKRKTGGTRGKLPRQLSGLGKGTEEPGPTRSGSWAFLFKTKTIKGKRTKRPTIRVYSYLQTGTGSKYNGAECLLLSPSSLPYGQGGVVVGGKTQKKVERCNPLKERILWGGEDNLILARREISGMYDKKKAEKKLQIGAGI